MQYTLGMILEVKGAPRAAGPKETTKVKRVKELKSESFHTNDTTNI